MVKEGERGGGGKLSIHIAYCWLNRGWWRRGGGQRDSACTIYGEREMCSKMKMCTEWNMEVKNDDSYISCYPRG